MDKKIPANIFSVFLSTNLGESKFAMGGLPKFLQNRSLEIQYHDNVITELFTSNYGGDNKWAQAARGYESNYWSIEFTNAKLDQQSLESKAT